MKCLAVSAGIDIPLHSVSHQVSGTTGVANRAGAAKRLLATCTFSLPHAPSTLPGGFEEDFAARLVRKGRARSYARPGGQVVAPIDTWLDPQMHQKHTAIVCVRVCVHQIFSGRLEPFLTSPC